MRPLLWRFLGSYHPKSVHVSKYKLYTSKPGHKWQKIDSDKFQFEKHFLRKKLNPLAATYDKPVWQPFVGKLLLCHRFICDAIPWPRSTLEALMSRQLRKLNYVFSHVKCNIWKLIWKFIRPGSMRKISINYYLGIRTTSRPLKQSIRSWKCVLGSIDYKLCPILLTLTMSNVETT